MSLKTILKNFLNHVDTLEAQRKVGKDVYEIDFQKLKGLTEQLKHDKSYDTAEGLKDVNRKKNRYKDILPYDYTRVVLSEYPGVPGSDYINANYIKGASGSLAYIASQGPLPNTIVDFWRMIWECEVQVIVMACNEQESGKYKCECYWPGEDEKKQYGNINVELVKWRQVCPDFLVRTLKACWEDEERVLCQFHYTTWPDHGVPNSVQPILELVRLIRDCQASEAVPVLIHCSAGCGRTGTICAIDYVWGLMRTGKLTKSFDLYNIISDMRRQRIAMVQTKEQYVLVYKAVSSLFEQQLRVIDSHTYENLDEDGEPLVFKELEEAVYEDIMEFDVEDNKANETQADDESSTKDYNNLPDAEPLYPVLRNILNEKALKSESHSGSSKKRSSSHQKHKVAPETSTSLSQDSHHNYATLQSTSEADTVKEDSSLPSSRNSTILRKLCREESVKRLISGWNRAVQQLEDSKAAREEKVSNNTHKSKADSSHGKNKSSSQKEQQKKSAKGKEKIHSAEYEKAKSHRSSEAEIKVQSSHQKEDSNGQQHSQDNKSQGNGSKIFLFEDSHHSGKLVGKATVIRRPSIAKLKALFEKSPACNAENSSEESSRRRRPLFRSHSHYVGHSRTFSVPDATEMRTELMSSHYDTSMCTPDPLLNNSNVDSPNQISNNQKHSEIDAPLYSHQNVQKMSCSPESLNSMSYFIQSSERPNKDVYSFSKDDLYSSENRSIDNLEKECYRRSTDVGSVNVAERNFSTYSCREENTFLRNDMESNVKIQPLLNSCNLHDMPFFQRFKQYTSPTVIENSSVLTKTLTDNKEMPQMVIHGEFNRDGKNFMPQNSITPHSCVKENNLQKMILSKSEDFYTTPKVSVDSNNEKDSDDENENTTPKHLLISSSPIDRSVNNTSNEWEEKNKKRSLDLAKSNLISKVENIDAMKKGSYSLVSTKEVACEPLYGHTVGFHLASSKLVSSVYNHSLKDNKYTNVNTFSENNLQQIEEKLKNHPRGAIIDLTSRKSYIEESSSSAYERPPTFISKNQPVKLSQPMETQDLKVPEKPPKDYSSFSSTPHQASDSTANNNKVTRSQLKDDVSKNLLLHSPPLKSKRSHSSKSSQNNGIFHHSKSQQKEMPDLPNKENRHSLKLQDIAKEDYPSISSGEVKSNSFNTSSSSGPVSRSDPRYFPVTTTVPKQPSEDTKFSTEKHLFEAKKNEALMQPTSLSSNFHPSSYATTTAAHNPAKFTSPYYATTMQESQISKILPKPYTPNAYKPHDHVNPWHIKSGEEIYGVRPVPSGQNAPNKVVKNEPVNHYSFYRDPHKPVSHTKSNPSSYSGAQENTYSSVKQTIPTPHGAYPIGPPKPPRLFNHKFKHENGESNNLKNVPSHENGGRYLVSVASPKQGSEQISDYAPSEKKNIEYRPVHMMMKHSSVLPYSSPFPEKQQPKDQVMPRFYPTATYSSRAAEKPYQEAAGNNQNYVTPSPPKLHSMYHPNSESNQHQSSEPLYSTVMRRNKYPDYENMEDARRDVPVSGANKPHMGLHHSNAIGSQGIQYSLSDASIYGVIQNHSSVYGSANACQPYGSNYSKMSENDVEASSVPKRVYFDTLQRRHKQQVSWEQRRSHDDMDIRPAPSARLKEQIHARRSLVELDNLEISVATDNGFQDPNSTLHFILPRKEPCQDVNIRQGIQKKAPIEFSDSLATKEIHRKSQAPTKESGSFSGTLYKAFGKLTSSLTKFNTKDDPNRSLPDHVSSSTKTPVSSSDEKSSDEHFAQWSQKTTKDSQCSPSEQWTEV